MKYLKFLLKAVLIVVVLLGCAAGIYYLTLPEQAKYYPFITEDTRGAFGPNFHFYTFYDDGKLKTETIINLPFDGGISSGDESFSKRILTYYPSGNIQSKDTGYSYIEYYDEKPLFSYDQKVLGPSICLPRYENVTINSGFFDLDYLYRIKLSNYYSDTKYEYDESGRITDFEYNRRRFQTVKNDGNKIDDFEYGLTPYECITYQTDDYYSCRVRYELYNDHYLRDYEYIYGDGYIKKIHRGGLMPLEIIWRFDDRGLLSEMSENGQSFWFEYNEDGRLIFLKTETDILEYHYDNNRLVSIDCSTGYHCDYSYNSDGNLLLIEVKKDGQVIYGEFSEYDSLGRLIETGFVNAGNYGECYKYLKN